MAYEVVNERPLCLDRGRRYLRGCAFGDGVKMRLFDRIKSFLDFPWKIWVDGLWGDLE